jgi:hypothetical protein
MSENTQEPGDAIALSDAIAHLRGELQKAMAEGAGKQTRFRAKVIELELSIAFSREGKGKAGIRAWVFELGGEASVKRDEIHRIKLQLELEGDPLISDPTMPPLESGD